jgi:AcrR family transcriptional regulator
MSDLALSAGAALDSESEPNDPALLACGSVRRGRPSIAEAEALSGRILDASWDVLLAGGFENFTFDRVARHAHIGKATIYSRFQGKIDLMQALLLRRIEQRTDYIKQHGADLPVEAAFRLRAADIMKMLFSPDGVMTERLIDWLDQEIGEGQQMRANAYRNAIDSISYTLIEGPDAAGLKVPDVDRAARLWLEGLIGHARLANTEGASSAVEIDLWANDYTQFYFAGLRAMSREN